MSEFPSLKDIFLAGVGALSMTGEKAEEFLDECIKKGELTVEQGKKLNEELSHKIVDKTSAVRDDVLEKQIAAMSPEQRAAYAAKVAELVDAAQKPAEEPAE